MKSHTGAGGIDVRERAVAAAEEAWAAHAPALRAAALKLRIAPRDVEATVRDVFAAYLANPPQVRDVRSYLLRSLCDAARHPSRNIDARR